MKIVLRGSERYRGYEFSVDEERGVLLVRDAGGNVVAELVLDDFLDRLMEPGHEFKRRYPRLRIGVHVKYQDGEGRNCEAIASSLGGGGLFIDQLNPLPHGAETDLQFSLPASRGVVRAQGKVVWSREQFVQILQYPGMGVQFTAISDRDRAEIIQFINTFSFGRGVRR